MATVEVKQVNVSVKTIAVNRSFLIQLEEISLETLIANKEGILGWVHGTVFVKDEDYCTWVIVALPDHQYGRYSAMQDARKKYKQLYI